MTRIAGSVITLLGGKLDRGEYDRFDAANKKAIATSEAAEAKMTAAAGRVAQAHERMAKGVDSVAQAAQRLGSSIPLAAMDRWEKDSARATKSVETLGRGATKTAGVGILALAAATVYAIKTSGDFERQMRNVNSIAKLSEDGYHKLSKSVLDLSGETAQAPKVLAEGMYQLVSSGFDATDSLTILRASAKAATAGLTDTATATKAVAAVLNAYRLPADQASKVSDILFETVNRGVLTFAELSKEIGTVLPFAAALHVSLPQVGAAISTMTKEGISAPETMTRIKQAMVSIIKPSADMKKAIVATGASSGQALVQQKGFQGALEAILKTTNGSKESLAKLFPNIRALGGVLALTGKNAKSAAGDLKAFQDTTGATKQVFDEQAKGAEFAGKRLLSSLEADAIIIGQRFLPIVANGAKQLTDALRQAAQDGSLQSIATGALSIFETIGSAIGDFIGPAERAGSLVIHLAAALSQLSSAAGLGLSGQLATIAGAFIAFKVADTVVPILFAIGEGIMFIGTSIATAGSVSAFGADLVALAGGPVGAVIAALTLAGAAFVAIESGLFSSASAADRNAEALRADKAALEALNKATTKTIEDELEAKQAKLDHKSATEQLEKTEKLHREGKASGDQLDQARLNQERAVLREQTTVAASQASLEAQRQAAEKARGQLGQRSSQVKGQIKDLERENDLYGNQNRALSTGEKAQTRLTNLRREYNDLLDQQQRLTAQITVSELSRSRKEVISPTNAPDIANLLSTLSAVPAKVRTQYELTGSQDTLAKLGEITRALEQVGQRDTAIKILTTAPSASAAILAMRAILAGVPATKVIKILHNAPSAKAAIGQLHGAINAVPGSKSIAISSNASQVKSEIAGIQASIDGLSGKSIAVTVNRAFNTVENVVKRVTGHASGRPSGDEEAALVGEGRGSEYVIDGRTGEGTRVDRPTLMGLGQDDYVVPLEDRFRGRALGLFAMLARDLEIPGYKAGKAPKRKHAMPVPDAIPPLSLPLSDIEQKEAAAKSKYEKAASKVTSLEGKVRTAERNLQFASKKGTAKKKDAAKLKELQGELRNAKGSHDYTIEHREMQEWAKTLQDAKAFQAQINDRTLEANNAGNAMKLAAEHGDIAGYDTAKGKRVGALGQLEKLIAKARKQVKTGSEYALQLEGQLQGAQIEAGEAEAQVPTNPAAEREEQSGMTDPEAAELKGLEAQQALAALTPGLADDTTAAQQIQGFFERLLGEVQAEPAQRGGEETIKNIAQQVAQARSNARSLIEGVGENSNQDLQAQLAQANERAEVEKQRADINEQFVRVAGGSGDIGQGGPNASAAVIQNNYMLHPSDPAVLQTIGAAAVGGIGYQNGRRAVRVNVGP